MAYRVTAPEVSILRDLSEHKDHEGKTIGFDRESVVYVQGDVIADSDVAGVVKEAYEAGDPHVRGLIEYTDDDAPAPADTDHDVNQDLNLADAEAPVEEKEFDTVQYPEDGPQEHKPVEKADAVSEETVEPSSDSEADSEPPAKKTRKKKAAKAADKE